MKSGTKTKLDVCLDCLAVAIAVFLVSTIVVQIFTRYFLQSSTRWADEVAPYMLAWITFYGSILSMRDGEHLEVSVLTDILSEKLRAVIIVFGYIVVAAFLYFFFYASLLLIKTTGMQISAATQIKNYFWYSIMPVSAVGMFVFNIINMITYIKSTWGKGE